MKKTPTMDLPVDALKSAVGKVSAVEKAVEKGVRRGSEAVSPVAIKKDVQMAVGTAKNVAHKGAEAAQVAREKSKDGVQLVGKQTLADAKNVSRDILSGQDGLGSVVKVIAEKDERLDKALHCCNKVGFKWADKHRIPLLSLNVLIGAASFGLGLCGAFGLGNFCMRSLP